MSVVRIFSVGIGLTAVLTVATACGGSEKSSPSSTSSSSAASSTSATSTSAAAQTTSSASASGSAPLGDYTYLLLAASDIVTLHAPLTAGTHHLIVEARQDGVVEMSQEHVAHEVAVEPPTAAVTEQDARPVRHGHRPTGRAPGSESGPRTSPRWRPCRRPPASRACSGGRTADSRAGR